MSKTDVTIGVRPDGDKFVGFVRSAKTGREMFATSPKADAGQARLFALGVVVDRKWNEVVAPPKST
jgi:hypothetical protein